MKIKILLSTLLVAVALSTFSMTVQAFTTSNNKSVNTTEFVAPTADIRGRVKYLSHPGYNVQVIASNPQIGTFYTYTDINGYYTITVPGNVTYTVNAWDARGSEFHPFYYTVPVTNQTVDNINFQAVDH